MGMGRLAARSVSIGPSCPRTPNPMTLAVLSFDDSMVLAPADELWDDDSER